MPGLDRPAFRWMAGALLLGAAGGTLYLATEGRWIHAAALGALVLIGTTLMAVRHRLPAFFTLLFVAAGLVNALGYILTLWHEGTVFDEAVHAFTSFTLCAAAGWLLVSRTALVGEGNSLRLILAVVLTGLVLGVLWEALEWIIGIIGGPRDTMMDLVMDLAGAVAAGLFCALVARRRRRGEPAAQASFGR